MSLKDQVILISNTRELNCLQALNLVRPTRENLVLDPPTVQHLNNRLSIMHKCPDFWPYGFYFLVVQFASTSPLQIDTFDLTFYLNYNPAERKKNCLLRTSHQ